MAGKVPRMILVSKGLVGRIPLWLLMIGVLSSGCGSKQQKQTQSSPQSPVERVRLEVAGILGKKAGDIDISKPLTEQGADELDIVEIVMALEEAFKVEIPDSAIGETVSEVSKTLTVEKLTEIVSKQVPK